MAENVQAALDEMVDPLRDLMERSIFSPDEIRAIVSRRRDSEYLLRRQIPRKADYVRYLEQEMKLERLRELRTKRLYKRPKTKEQHDSHIIKHIHRLFQRAIRIFRDLALILEYAEFCKQKRSNLALARLYGEALQWFPREAGLWIEAASHEYFYAKSIHKARILLQRGIRTNPHNAELWIQYCTLELHFIQKLKGRQAILSRANDNDEEAAAASAPPGGSMKVPCLVYKNAIKSIPDDLSMRLKFLETCDMFPDTQELQEQIIESLEGDFGKDENAWMARAMWALSQGKGSSRKIIDDYENREDNSDDEENVCGGDVDNDEESSHGDSDDDKDEKEDEDGDDEDSDDEDGDDEDGDEEDGDDEDSDDEDDGGKGGEEDDQSSGREKKRARRELSAVEILKEALDALPTPEMYLQVIHFLQSHQDGIVPDSFLKHIWSKAPKTCAIVLARARHSPPQEGAEILEDFCRKYGNNKEHHSSKPSILLVHVEWAQLVEDPKAAVSILKQAKQLYTNSTDMSEEEYMLLLCRLVHTMVQVETYKFVKIFHTAMEPLLLLLPSRIDDPRIVMEWGGACLALVHYTTETMLSLPDTRKLYKAVLFSSRNNITNAALLRFSAQQHEDDFDGDENDSHLSLLQTMKSFVDKCICMEQQKETCKKQKQEHLRLLHDKALDLFRETKHENLFRRKREDFLYGGGI